MNRASIGLPLLLLLSAACTSKESAKSTASALRPAADTPAQFGTLQPIKGDECLNPIVDPRNGAKLTLVQSHEGIGDYEGAPGTYGLEAGEVLRVECKTGKPMGIAKKKGS